MGKKIPPASNRMVNKMISTDYIYMDLPQALGFLCVAIIGFAIVLWWTQKKEPKK